MLAPHAQKGQKLLAQGSALGIIAIGKAPCKAKALCIALIFKASALSGRAASMRFWAFSPYFNHLRNLS